MFDDVGDRDLVALGGGRVIDVAKAIAAVTGSRVAALPTTLSGAEMTRIHRLPDGHEAIGGLVRPQVVIADPPLMVGLPEERLRASAMNALAHGADSLYTPLANPVSEMAALRGATLIANALDTPRAEREPAAARPRLDPLRLRARLGAVRPPPRRLPDAGPRAARSRTRRPTRRCSRARSRCSSPRAGPQMTALARALGVRRAELRRSRSTELGGGPRRLSELGADRDGIDAGGQGDPGAPGAAADARRPRARASCAS